ncbi:DUF3967 domain-containing protein [Bacillus haynesii]|uniref:DUF3967 domain-containing protein n=1 Tax=Bacillus haynesii TaxID=1925021 RepID=UPI00227EDB20|nr:DUF3967 domain-containing protein [Bacillus haynesii]MCY7860909.1 DUF3967 domain-containing protein [Bacillus haynesii]
MLDGLKIDHALLQFVKQQEEFNKMMLERIELFEKRQKERDEMLMKSLRESQETQKKCWPPSARKSDGNSGNDLPC